MACGAPASGMAAVTVWLVRLAVQAKQTKKMPIRCGRKSRNPPVSMVRGMCMVTSRRSRRARCCNPGQCAVRKKRKQRPDYRLEVGLGQESLPTPSYHGNATGACHDQPDIAPAQHCQNRRFDNPVAKTVGGGVR